MIQVEEQPQEFIDNYTVIDIETTGLSCEKNEIIELSALKIRDNKIVDEFSSLVKPAGHINSFIRGLTGISDELVKDASDITKVLPNFISFIDNDTVLGHNVKFDLRFIKYNLKKHFQKDFNNAAVDTMRVSRKYCTELTSHRLQVLAEHFNISTKGHHRALKDCEITNDVYQNIKNGLSK